MKYIAITAHISEEPCNDDCMFLYEMKTVYEGLSDNPMLTILSTLFPAFKWEIDDGEDTLESDYCQYVAYTDKYNERNYVLAAMCND